jgi:hypothetical protein
MDFVSIIGYVVGIWGLLALIVYIVASLTGLL